MSPIPVYVWLPPLLVAVFYSGCLLTALLRAGSRRPRPGGYRKPPVSARTRDGGQPPQATGITARISSYSPPGSRLAAPVRLRALPPRSRPIVLTSSGDVTVDRGGSGELRLVPPAGSNGAA